jgi:hypothetical protein
VYQRIIYKICKDLERFLIKEYLETVSNIRSIFLPVCSTFYSFLGFALDLKLSSKIQPKKLEKESK